MEPSVSNTVALTAGTVSAEDKVTVYGWKALAGSVIGYAMDGFDMLILGFMLAAISADLALTSTQAGSLVTWTLMGAVAGGFIFGTMNDHFGRIRVLTWTILLFAGFTGPCAIAQGYWDLAVYRIIAGLGLGGVLAAHYSFHTAIAMLASIYVVDILATLFLIPELKGKELE
jgi:MFS family permease